MADIAFVFDEVSFWSARFGALLFKHLPILPNQSILDLGCCNGFPLFELAHSFGPTCTVTGIDVWEDALERARRKAAVYGLDTVRIVQGNGASMPFEDREFSLVVSNVGVNNFDDPRAVLRECRRVLQPGGRIAITTNVQGHMQEFYAVFRTVLTDFGNAEYLKRLQANEEHRGSPAQVQELLRDAGFSLCKTEREEFTMRYLDGSALLRHFLCRAGFMDGWRSVVDPEHEAHVFSQLENRLNALAHEAGELRMTVPMVYLEAQKP